MFGKIDSDGLLFRCTISQTKLSFVLCELLIVEKKIAESAKKVKPSPINFSEVTT
jgi:hypothetical protein